MRKRNHYADLSTAFPEPVSNSYAAECILAGNSLILEASSFAAGVGQMAQQSEQQLRQLPEEVRVLSKQMTANSIKYYC